MVVFRGSRYPRHNKRSNQNGDRLVKIIITQSVITAIGMFGFFGFNSLVGISEEKKQSLIGNIVEHLSPQEMVFCVSSVFNDYGDSYIAKMVEQVINLYQEPVEVVAPPIQKVPIIKPHIDKILEPSANIEGDGLTSPSENIEREKLENQSTDAYEKEVKAGIEQEKLEEQPPLPIKSSDIKSVDTKSKVRESQLVRFDINVPKDVVIGGIVTSGYGFRKHPITDKQDYHTGVDISAKIGSEILAPRDGKVLATGKDYAYGNYLIIDHGDGIITYYCHCQKILVKTDKLVKAKEAVAKLGNTGLSTGPHLHFEVMIDGCYVDPQNLEQGWGVV